MRVEQLAVFDGLESGGGTFAAMQSALGFASAPGWPDRFGARFTDWLQRRGVKPISTLSLFTGLGGLDIGFEDCGFHISRAVEIDERFVETLKLNRAAGGRLQGTDVLNRDIREYDPDPSESYEFVVGGPPCQTFSAAGRRAAGVLGTDDSRGTLFEEYIRVLRALSPPPIGFLFENVYGITGAQGGQPWREIISGFASAGYRVFWRILDAADYGVPQHRERLFIVGLRSGEYCFPRPTHGPDSPTAEPHFSAGSAIGGVRLSRGEATARVGGRYGELLDEIPPGLNYSFYTSRMGHPRPLFAWRSKFSDFLYKADPERPVRTLKAQGGQFTGPFHWNNRPFSVSELKRLQTIPDDYAIAGGRQVAIHQIGNSVPPQLARVLALSVLSQVFSVDLPFGLPLLRHSEKLGFRRRKRRLTSVYREKATHALSGVDSARQDLPCPVKRTYYASVTPGLGWVESRRRRTDSDYRVGFRPGSRAWRIRVEERESGARVAFTVQLTPSPRSGWVLPVDEVLLQGTSRRAEIFTALWKALEAELSRNSIKADLVQLSGYYQYGSTFTCRLRHHVGGRPSRLWRALQRVMEGRGVGRILSVAALAQEWGVREEEVRPVASELKRMGYEVRNRRTNPQLPDGSYLVPYCFPTLAPMSVQRRKSLEPDHGD